MSSPASPASPASPDSPARPAAAPPADALPGLVHRRQNLLNGDWVLVSPQRNLRPWQGQQERTDTPAAVAHDPACYLCAGNARVNGAVNPDYRGPWAFTNDFPALLPAGTAPAATAPAPSNLSTSAPGGPAHPLFVAETVHGTARVVCFSPDHGATLATLPPDAIAAVVRCWCDESAALAEDYPWVQVFENKGALMGCSNPHPHSQIWALSTLPREAVREDGCQQAWHATQGRALLLALAEAEQADGARVVCSNADWLVVVPWWAAWPFETLLLPRFAVQRLQDLAPTQVTTLASVLADLTRRYDQLFDCSFPYTMGWHGAPNTPTDNRHWQLHAHFLPPLLRSATVRKFMVGFELLAEAQRDLTPEQAAARLRALPGLAAPQPAAPAGRDAGLAQTGRPAEAP